MTHHKTPLLGLRDASISGETGEWGLQCRAGTTAVRGLPPGASRHLAAMTPSLGALVLRVPGESFPPLAFTPGPTPASVGLDSAETRCSETGAGQAFLPELIAPARTRHLAPCSAILGSWLAADHTFKHAVAIYWPYKLILVGVQLIEIKA